MPHRLRRTVPPRPVQSISTAPLSRRVDQDTRLRNYLISMSIRTACVALAGLFAIWTPWIAAAWVCVAAAVLLPYPAVVYANTIARRTHRVELIAPQRAIGPGDSGTRHLL